MREFMYVLEHNYADQILGTLVILLFYTFARLLGARFHVAIAFSAIPVIVAWAYRYGAIEDLMRAVS